MLDAQIFRNGKLEMIVEGVLVYQNRADDYIVESGKGEEFLFQKRMGYTVKMIEGGRK